MLKNITVFILIWLAGLTITLNVIIPKTAAYKAASAQWEQVVTENHLDLPTQGPYRHGFAIGNIVMHQPVFLTITLLLHTLVIFLLFLSMKWIFKVRPKNILLSDPLESFKNILSNLLLFILGVFNNRAASQLRIYFDLPVGSRIIGLLAYSIVFLSIIVSYNVPQMPMGMQFTFISYFQLVVIMTLLSLVFFVKPFRKHFERKLFWLSLGGLLVVLTVSVLIGFQLARSNINDFSALEYTSSVLNPKTVLLNVLIVLAFSFYIEVMKQLNAQKAQSEAEMQVARRIQQELLPVLSFDNDAFGLYGRTVSASQVGGDYCDAIALPDGRYAVAVGDVSGHNVAAGLLMSMLKVAFRTELNYLNDPVELAASLNRTIFDNKNKNMFVSFLFILIDPAKQSLDLLNCGHPPLLHLDSVTGTVKESRTGDLALGLQREASFKAQKIGYNPGDVLVMVSDGLLETVNSMGQEWGIVPIQSLLKTSTEHNSQKLYERMISASRKFSGNVPARDDITLVVIRMNEYQR